MFICNIVDIDIYIIFMDPSDGLGWQITYNEAVNGVDGSIFAWIRTLYNFSR